MRIRKRQVGMLFPLSPVTHSDPHLINRLPVVVQLNEATTITPPKQPSCTHDGSATAPIPTLDLSQPSDQPLPPIRKPINGSDESKRQPKKQECLVEDRDVKGQDDDKRKEDILGSKYLPPSSPSKQDGMWCEGEKVVPLKKRRGSIENMTSKNSNNDSNNNNKKKKVLKSTRMKTKMNKKFNLGQEDSSEEEEEEEEVIKETKPSEVNNVGGKKRVRGGALMEGSRCSRVNGRGWRCCQQTLVGYSLCEHHLGKGRLRSMTSVRNRSNIAKNMQELPLLPEASSASSFVTDRLDINEENGEKMKPMMSTKKRVKLGMVKARSISNLLGQTNTEVGATQNNNK